MKGKELNLKQIDLKHEPTLRELFRKFFPRAQSFATQLLRDKMTAANVIQEAFLYMWEKASVFPDEPSFKAYLYYCVKNRSLNYIRDHRVKRHMEELQEAWADEDAVDRLLIKQELKARVLEEINRLPDVRKEILLLRLEGNSYDDISRELNLNINTLKTYRKQAYRELRGRLVDLGKYVLGFAGIIIWCI